MRMSQKIELFNKAFPLAWAQITAPVNREKSWELGQRLGAIIKSSIDAGIEDVDAIADAAAQAVKIGES